MTFSDYVLDSLLVLIVFRQLRESRLDLRAVLLPVGICGYFGFHYLHSLPTAGNDLVLIGALTALGVVLGVISALTTRVRSDGGRYPLVQAGAVAAGAWVLGMGLRFGFSVWTSHGGDAAVGRFSVAHDITGAGAWTDALVLMAFGEVFVRTGILWLRGQRAVAAQQHHETQVLTTA